jgi:hypothetical protein
MLGIVSARVVNVKARNGIGLPIKVRSRYDAALLRVIDAVGARLTSGGGKT